MSRFSRPTRGLQQLFPSSDRSVAAPGELADTVNLVHPYPGRLWERATSIQRLSSNVVAPSLIIISSNSDQYREIIALDLSHDSVTAADLQLILQSPTGQNTFIARLTNMVAVLTPGQPSGFFPMFGVPSFSAAGTDAVLLPGRSLILPPGFILVALGSTEAVAYTIAAGVIVVDHALSEEPFFA